jgi:hypothetical protein
VTSFVPQPGSDWPPGLNYAQSFGGVVSAFNDMRVANFKEPKVYPNNFSGIIAAVKDLEDWGNAGMGEVPPGWVPTIDENGVITGGAWTQTPKEGQLWFDLRDGRLKIWYGGTSGDFYQVNGADGLTTVGTTAPAEAPEGAQWFNTSNNSLYLYYSGTWSLLSGGAASFDTLTLLLTTAQSTALANAPTSGALPSGAGKTKQNDMNVWSLDSLIALDAAITNLRPNTFIQISATAPNVATAVAGDLWYDSTNYDLKIFYKPDANPGTWKPVQETSAGQSQIDTLTANLATTDANLAAEISTTNAEITALQTTDTTNLTNLTALNTALDTRVTTLENAPTPALASDLPNYVLATTYNPAIASLNTQIATVDASIPDVSSFATTAALNTEVANRQAADANFATTANLTTEVATLNTSIGTTNTAVALKADITYVDTQVAAVTVDEFTDTVEMKVADLAKATLDFSGDHTYARNAFKYKSFDSAANTDYYTSFGTTADLWEYAWDFTDNEDFCWKHTASGVTSKVFSVSKDGPACSNLIIGDFAANTSAGRQLSNTIDVKDRLTKHKAALEGIRTACNDAAITDVAALKTAIAAALVNV